MAVIDIKENVQVHGVTYNKAVKGTPRRPRDKSNEMLIKFVLGPTIDLTIHFNRVNLRVQRRENENKMRYRKVHKPTNSFPGYAHIRILDFTCNFTRPVH